MKTYKQLKEVIEKRIERDLKCEDGNLDLFQCFDVWIALNERDTETPEGEKRERAREYAEIAENILTNPSTKEIVQWTFSVVALRQAAGMTQEGEKKAQLYQVDP